MVHRGTYDRGFDQASLVPFPSSGSPSRRNLPVGTFEKILDYAEPKAYIDETQVSLFTKEACICRDDRDSVPFNLRRAGILPVCHAPIYLRQEGGRHGT